MAAGKPAGLRAKKAMNVAPRSQGHKSRAARISRTNLPKAIERFNVHKAFERRSPLPSAKKIAAWNRERPQEPAGQQDKRTYGERQFERSNGQLRANNLSRNHKVSDHSIGRMLKQAFDRKSWGDPDKLAKEMFQHLSPADEAKYRNDYERARSVLSNPKSSLLAKVGAAKVMKRTLSANPANLRLGDARTNSAIGARLDLNRSGSGFSPISTGAVKAFPGSFGSSSSSPPPMSLGSSAAAAAAAGASASQRSFGTSFFRR